MITAHLPEIFLTLTGFAVLAYAVLDGYDLGVGMLMPLNNESHRDVMISTIGPFWDANETWLVLAVGLLLIAFPFANSVIFAALYLPTFFLIVGLILRGVSFDFRAKAKSEHKDRWDTLFRLGSWIAALTQGYMIGRWVLGFATGWLAESFALLSALCVAAAYAYIGGAWLVMKTEGEVQRQAARSARKAGWLAALGMVAVSIVNPLLSPDIATRWFSTPAVFLLAMVPLMCLLILISVDRYLANVPLRNDIGCWFPFVAVTLLFVLNFFGLAYSHFPDVIPGVMTAAEGASSTAALKVILFGVVTVLPVIIAYTTLAYRIFRGKTKELTYT